MIALIALLYMKSDVVTTHFDSLRYPQLNRIFSSPLWNKYPFMFIKGGAARSVFLNKVKSDSGVIPDDNIKIRDIDLVIFVTSTNEEEHYKIQRQVKWDIQADSILKNADIEWYYEFNTSSVTNYLNTRDTESNRAMIRPDTLVYSNEAYEYLINNLESSVTAYGRKYEYDEDGFPEYYKENDIYRPRLAIRAVLQALKEGLEIPDEEYWVANEADDFDLAIHLFKAYDDNTQDKFVKILFPALHRSGYMETKDDEPDDVLVSICDNYALEAGLYGIPEEYTQAKMNSRVNKMMEKEGITESISHDIFTECLESMDISPIQMKSILSIHNSIFESHQSRYVVRYHLTNRNFLQDILDNGLRMEHGHSGMNTYDHSPGIWLSGNRDLIPVLRTVHDDDKVLLKISMPYEFYISKERTYFPEGRCAKSIITKPYEHPVNSREGRTYVEKINSDIPPQFISVEPDIARNRNGDKKLSEYYRYILEETIPSIDTDTMTDNQVEEFLRNMPISMRKLNDTPGINIYEWKPGQLPIFAEDLD